jgi:beta-carotene 3-hydroxylase
MRNAAIIGLAFMVMEPVTYCVHRWVMHGFAIGWHQSHHQQRPGRFERNDLFPFVFASIVMTMWAIGLNVSGWTWLVPVGIGATLYGAVYGIIHDLYIHRRFVNLPRVKWLEHIAEAHRLHHRDAGEPYGLLVPTVSAQRRARLRSKASTI